MAVAIFPRVEKHSLIVTVLHRVKLNGTEISIVRAAKPLIYRRVGIAHQP